MPRVEGPGQGLGTGTGHQRAVSGEAGGRSQEGSGGGMTGGDAGLGGVKVKVCYSGCRHPHEPHPRMARREPYYSGTDLWCVLSGGGVLRHAVVGNIKEVFGDSAAAVEHSDP